MTPLMPSDSDKARATMRSFSDHRCLPPDHAGSRNRDGALEPRRKAHFPSLRLLPELLGFLVLVSSCSTKDMPCKNDGECTSGYCDPWTSTCQPKPLPDGAAGDVAPEVVDGLNGQDSVITDGAVLTDAHADAAGTCASSAECTAADQPLCQGGRCVRCQESANAGLTATCAAKNAAQPFCNQATGRCAECLESKTCGEAKPICGATVPNACGACSTDSQCKDKDSTKLACTPSGATAGQCVQCTLDSHCASVTDKPRCDTATNTCVRCLGHSDCSGASPICSAHACAACTSASECNAATSGAAPVCTASGGCVQCTQNSDCGSVAGKPFCDTVANKCVQCLADSACSGSTPICSSTKSCTACTASSQCAAKSGNAPACATSGTNAGACVDCVDDVTCSGTTPICEKGSNKCRRCEADSECTASPGVCMNHQDGRCATSSETIIVSGTLPSVDKLSSKPVVVVRGSVNGTAWDLGSMSQQVSLIGLGSGATVTGDARASAFVVSGGSAYIRNVTFSGATSGSGISVSAGTLALDHVTVTKNQTGLSCSAGATVTVSALSAEPAPANTTPTSGCTGVSSCGAPSTSCGAQ
jgi:hypothetical protein